MRVLSEPSGFCIQTYRLILECDHPEWLSENQKLYGELQQFYYSVLLRHREILDSGSQQSLRELEKLTVPSRGNPDAEEPLPWANIPAYFRRSAINATVGAVKSIRTRTEGKSLDTKLQNSVVLYGRMYKDFTSRKITIHVWNGADWVWMKCRLHGAALPDKDSEGVRWMSPVIVPGKEYNFLHVPVRQPVADARKLKDRMASGERICAVQFMNTECFAAVCILNGDGSQAAVRYIRGGGQYVHRCQEILSHIERSQDSGGSRGQAKADQKHWMRLKHQREYWAHRVSREILNFCTEYGAKVLTWEEYEPEYSKAVLKKCGNWSALHLSSRVKEYLGYKAWSEGILIATVKSFQIKERKFEPGEKNIQRARMVGRQCLGNFRAYADGSRYRTPGL